MYAFRNMKFVRKSASKNNSNNMLVCFKKPFYIVLS